MKKYLKQRIKEMKEQLKWHEKIASETKNKNVYDEAVKAIHHYMGGIKELEALCEEFDIEYDTKR